MKLSRVEAAAKAYYESGMYAAKWRLAQPAQREWNKSRMTEALAASDDLLFSEEAIERAAEIVDEFTHDRYSQCTSPKDAMKLVRDVIEALKDGAE